MRRATFGLVGLTAALIIGLIALTLAGIALGRSGGRTAVPGIASAQEHTVFVTGTGVASATPDLARFTVGVQEQGKDVIETQGTVASRSDAVLAALIGKGIDRSEDIKTANYSITLLYDYPQNQAPVLNGYRVVNTINVTVRGLDQDPKKIGLILDAVVRAGASTVGGISFGLSNPEKANQEARAEAMKNAQAKALVLAQMGGANLGPVLNVSDQTAKGLGAGDVADLTAGAAPAGAAATPQIVPGETSVTVTVNVTYTLK